MWEMEGEDKNGVDEEEEEEEEKQNKKREEEYKAVEEIFNLIEKGGVNLERLDVNQVLKWSPVAEKSKVGRNVYTGESRSNKYKKQATMKGLLVAANAEGQTSSKLFFYFQCFILFNQSIRWFCFTIF